eukprot:NODE_649_length_2504_cov_35.898782_g556_i0.p1 GENE.NODE_649_length_2504_cov_35.898782_g556_i0~~NODE_649_length_2504_cov_35.898782_g556_i0.p1  ORF type:complete len:749 (+),score=163.64 NODE_649_length_2504_cov_35.898782_g556_i0:178-2247(+)
MVQDIAEEYRISVRKAIQRLREIDEETRDLRQGNDTAVTQIQREINYEDSQTIYLQQENVNLSSRLQQSQEELSHLNEKEELVSVKVRQLEQNQPSISRGSESTVGPSDSDMEWEARTKLHEDARVMAERFLTFYRRYKVPYYTKVQENFNALREVMELYGQVALMEEPLMPQGAPCETPEAWEKYFREMGRKAATKIGDSTLWNVPEEGPRIFHSEFKESVKKLGKRTIAVRWLPHVPYAHIRTSKDNSEIPMKNIVAAAIKGHRAISPLGGFCLQVTQQPFLCRLFEVNDGRATLNPLVKCNNLNHSHPVLIPNGDTGDFKHTEMRIVDFMNEGVKSNCKMLELDESVFTINDQPLANTLSETIIPTTGRHLQRLVIPKSSETVRCHWNLNKGKVPLRTAPFQLLNLNTGSSIQIWYTFTPKQVDNQSIHNAIKKMFPDYRDGDSVFEIDMILLAAEVKQPMDILVQPPGWLVILEPGRWFTYKSMGYTSSISTFMAIHAIGQIRSLRDHLLLYKYGSKWPILWIAVRLMRKLRFNSPVMVTLMREIFNAYSQRIIEGTQLWGELNARANNNAVFTNYTSDFDSDSTFKNMEIYSCSECKNLIQVVRCGTRCIQCWKLYDNPANPLSDTFSIYVTSGLYENLCKALETTQMLLTDQANSRAQARPVTSSVSSVSLRSDSIASGSERT